MDLFKGETLEFVGQWLKENGLGKLEETFKGMFKIFLGYITFYTEIFKFSENRYRERMFPLEFRLNTAARRAINHMNFNKITKICAL